MNPVKLTVLFTLALLACLSMAALAQPPGGPSRESVKLPEGTLVHRDLACVTSRHEQQKLDLYLPKGGNNLALVVRKAAATVRDSG